MNRFKPHSTNDFSDALANFSLTFAKAMLVFAVVLMVMITPETKKDDGIKPKIDFLITIDWPKGDNDVDIWMRDPEGKIMYYGNKEAGVLNLERDDLGNPNNSIIVNGKAVISDVHEEEVSIRGILPGEYIVNVHLFRSENLPPNEPVATPIPVEVKIQKMNPTVTVVWKSTVYLARTKEEVHALRFTIHEDGSIDNMTASLPITLIEKLQP